MPGVGLGGELPVVSGVTGTTRLATGGDFSQYVAPVGYSGLATFDNTGVGYAGSVTTGSTMMGPAIQTIWSKEILFQSMPVLRFEQFAVKKTELGQMPGLTVNFMRYNNLPIPAGPLVEGVRMKTHAITAQQYAITVQEQGFAVAVSELLLNASFDDIMASASRLLGRNMALYMDNQARYTLSRASSVVFGYQKPTAINQGYGVYEPGTPAANVAAVTGAAATPASWYLLHPHSVKDAVEVLASKNVPRLGETYVCFIHPHQSRRLRDTPEWIEVTKYAAPGNFMLGEVGRLDDVVFIETTQITGPSSTTDITDPWPTLPGGAVTGAPGDAPDWRLNNLGVTAAQIAGGGTGTIAGYDPATDPFADITVPSGAGAGVPDVPPGSVDTYPVSVATPQWGAPWGPSTSVYEAIMLGDNAFGHAISLPVELRDGGVLDFGREHALAWYSIWGWGVVTESSVVKIITN
jgi:N4-gp56 family major capsid protein